MLLSREPLFEDKNVLSHSYTPDKLLHRELEVEKIASILVTSLKGCAPSNILVYGKSGTGKTIVTRFVCNLLLETTERREDVQNVSIAYINCKNVDTKYRVLANLTKELCETRIPFTGWPTDKVYKSFLEAIDKKKQCIVIILDEIDNLTGKQGDDILYNLTRMNSDLKNAMVSTIGISNNLRFLDYLDARVQSSLGSEEIVFTPYDARQLEEILTQRARLAFKPGTVDEFVIPLCAALAAREHGDARKALDLLKVSGEVAEREGTKRITESHVRSANEKIEKDNTVELVTTLPLQSKTIIYSILCLDSFGNTSINTGQTYETYTKACKVISIDCLTLRRVSDLISELGVLGILDARTVSKGRYGRTKNIKLEVSPTILRTLLEKDSRIKMLFKAFWKN